MATKGARVNSFQKATVVLLELPTCFGLAVGSATVKSTVPLLSKSMCSSLVCCSPVVRIAHSCLQIISLRLECYFKNDLKSEGISKISYWAA